MARKRGAVPAYRLHRNSGRGYVHVEGRQHLLPGAFNSPESLTTYNRFVAEWGAHGGRLPVEVEASAYTLADLDRDYRAHVEAKHDARWIANNMDRVRLALKAAVAMFGSEPLARFSPLKLQAVRQSMIDARWEEPDGEEGAEEPTPRDLRRLSRGEINERIGTIRRAVRWAVAQEKVPPDVAHGLAAVEALREGEFGVREGRRVGPVDEATVWATLPYLSRPAAALVELLWWTGARPSELLGLRPADIDRTGKVWIVQRAEHKTARHGRSREIAFGPKAQDVLRRFLDRVPRPAADRPLFSPADAVAELHRGRRANRRTPLYDSHLRRYEEQRKESPDCAPGEAYTATSFARAVTRAVDAENRERSRKAREHGLSEEQIAKLMLSRWTPYQLRHAAATRLRREFGLEMVRCVLGHASATMSEVYAEVDHERARQAMESAG